MSKEDEYRSLFFEETREHLEKIEGCLLELEKDPQYDCIHDLFRSVHTIKGSSAVMGYIQTSNLVHQMEDIIQTIRDGRTSLTPHKLEVFLKVYDHLARFIEAAALGESEDAFDITDPLSELKTLKNETDGVSLMESGDQEVSENREMPVTIETGIQIDGDMLVHIRESVVSGKLLLAIMIKTTEDSAFKTVRAWMAYDEVSRHAEIVASEPSKENIDIMMTSEGENPPEAVSFIVLTEMAPAELESQLISELSDIEYIYIEELRAEQDGLKGINLSFDEEQNVYRLDQKNIAFARLDLSETVNEAATEQNLMEQGLEDLLQEIKNIELILIEMCPNLQECERSCKKLPGVMRSLDNIDETALALDIPLVRKLASETSNHIKMIQTGKHLHDESNLQFIGHALDLAEKVIRCYKSHSPVPRELERKIGTLVNILQQDIMEFLDKNAVKKSTDQGEADQKKFETLAAAPAIKAQAQNKSPLIGLDVGQVLVKEGMTDANTVRKTINQQQAGNVQTAGTNYVRIPEHKVGSLFDLLGELIIMQSQQREDILSVLSGGDINRLNNNMGRMERVTKEIQSIAMSLRMVSIKATFQKILRVGMHTAKEINRDIRFEITGDETEVDRSVVEKLNDPLMHLIRNAVSHGIEEDQNERTALGKNPQGTIRMAASSAKGQVLIEVSDDGKGLDSSKILSKAIEKGLAQADKEYSDKEIANFIFLPGFSTQEKVNSISGRGVGMNVVEEEIKKVGGKVEIRTEKGKGTTFVLKIPINMATINGIVAEINKQRYVLPTMTVKRIFKPETDDWVSIRGHVDMVRYRGELIPLIPIAAILGGNFDIRDHIILAIEYEGEVRALPVKEVLGKQEIVIKPLDSTFNSLGFLAGSTIMGDGSAALIFDVESFFRKG